MKVCHRLLFLGMEPLRHHFLATYPNVSDYVRIGTEDQVARETIAGPASKAEMVQVKGNKVGCASW